MATTEQDPIMEAFRQANRLHALWLGAERKAAEVRDEQAALLAAVKKELQDMEVATQRTIGEAAKAAQSAKQALVEFQEKAYKELGIGIDLTKATSTGGGRVSL